MSIALRFIRLWTVTLLLASCASHSPAPEDPPIISRPTPPQADVVWENRVDYEPWQAPLPPGRDPWPTESPSRWPDLRPRLILPSTVTKGDAVDYVIELRNVSEHSVDLRPCGGYEQEVMGVGAGLAAVSVERGKSTFRLNCDADPILLPAASRRYAMHIVVPSGLTGSEVLVRWGFVDNMPDYEAQTWIGLTPR